MKFSTALVLGLAPLSLARKVRNSYPPLRRSSELDARNGHLQQGGGGEHLLGGGNGLLLDSTGGQGFGSQSSANVIIIWANPGGQAETTTYNQKVTVTQTVTAAPGGQTVAPGDGGVTQTLGQGETATVPNAGAASHTVTVGGPAGLVYTPDQLKDVPVGDMVVFEFQSQNHTLTQSGFDTPCQAMKGGMDSGHQPNPNNSVVPPPQVAMQVTTSDPLWFYCKTGDHCGQGMVFSINPTAEKSQAQFKEKAIAQNGKGKETPITGGEQPAQESPATPPAESPASGGDMGATPGQGTIGSDGSCLCVVSCSSGGFPAVNAQGIGAVGGQSGSLPANMAALR